MKRLMLTLVAFALVVTACSSPGFSDAAPGLSDADLVWCDANKGTVREAGDALSFSHSDTAFKVWMEHPDGIRACEAAIENYVRFGLATVP